MTIEIIAESEHWLAINKPKRTTVHNQMGEDVVSLLKGAGYLDLHPAHRLDAGTTGVMLLAKGVESAKLLHGLFESRSIAKYYVAKCAYETKTNLKAGDHGVWRWSLTKRAESRKSPRGWAGKRVPCRTKWQVAFQSAAHIEYICYLETGRKHQIRRHAAVAGNPIIGDFRYGPTPVDDEMAATTDLHLHSWQLRFIDPWTKQSNRIIATLPSWSEGDLDSLKLDCEDDENEN